MLTDLDLSLFQNIKNFPTEIVYEITTQRNKLPWGIAIADILESKLHMHKKTYEFYLVLEGDLKVYLGDKELVLHPMDRIDIPVGTAHKAKSLSTNPCRVLVVCCPEFDAQDYHALEK